MHRWLALLALLYGLLGLWAMLHQRPPQPHGPPPDRQAYPMEERPGMGGEMNREWRHNEGGERRDQRRAPEDRRQRRRPADPLPEGSEQGGR